MALADCISVIERDREELATMEPDNGWGSVDGVLVFLREIMFACRENPLAIVRVS